MMYNNINGVTLLKEIRHEILFQLMGHREVVVCNTSDSKCPYPSKIK